MLTAADFTIGIEEEHLLVERGSGALAVEPPEAMLSECEGLMGGQVNPEFLKCQIEVSTRVCHSLGEARADLVGLRTAIAGVAARHGLAPIAASTHPLRAGANSAIPTANAMTGSPATLPAWRAG